jgi:hypothetical protein
MNAAQKQLDVYSGKAQSAGRATREFGKTQGSIRTQLGLLDNTIRGAHAQAMSDMVRRYSDSKIVMAALPIAANAAAFVLLAGIIVSVTEKMVAWRQATKDAAFTMASAWNSLVVSGQLADDELQKTNDTLSNSILKLEGKPQNNLAVALDDARIMADKLAQSLDSDNKKITQLLKANSIGFFQSLATGNSDTGELSTKVKAATQELATLGFAYQSAVRSHGADSAQAQAAQTAIDKSRQHAERMMQTEIAARTGKLRGAALLGTGITPGELGGDQSGNLDIARGVLGSLWSQDDLEKEQKQNNALTGKDQALTHAKELTAAQKEAQAKLFQTWQQGLDRLKGQYSVSEQTEVDYWLHMASTVKAGSLDYTKALGEAYKLMGAVRKSTASEYDKYRAAQYGPDESFVGSAGQIEHGTYKPGDDLTKNPGAMRYEQSQGHSVALWAQGLAKSGDVQEANRLALERTTLQVQVATGQISKLAAAQKKASIDADGYAYSLSDLQEKLNQVANNPLLSKLDKNAQEQTLQNQIDALNGQWAVTRVQNQARIDQSQLGTSIRDSLDQYAEQATDVAAQISSTLTGAFTGVNGSLSTSLMSRDVNGYEYRKNIENSLASTGRNLGSTVLNHSFQNIEGSVLKAFGHTGGAGKPDGSQGKPWYVRMMDGAGAGVKGSAGFFGGIFGNLFGHHNGSTPNLGGIAKGMGGILPNIFGSDAPPPVQSFAVKPSAVMSGLGSVLSSIPFAGFFQTGGDVLAHHSAIVGENGPEMFIPHTSGRIVPNDSRGGVTHNTSIDARGSQDPAATEAAVNRAMLRWKPYLNASSRANAADSKRRKPFKS